MKALQLPKPHLLIVIGIPGSGKTTFASKFSDTFHAPFIESQLFRSLTDDRGQADALLDNMLDQVQKTNQTIIYEPTSGTRSERLELAKKARASGYEPLLIWVQTDHYAAMARATRRKRAAADQMSEEQFEQEVRRFTAPNAQEKYVVISGMHTYSTQAKAVLKKLTENNQRPAANTPPRGDTINVQQRRPRLVR